MTTPYVVRGRAGIDACRISCAGVRCRHKGGDAPGGGYNMASCCATVAAALLASERIVEALSDTCSDRAGSEGGGGGGEGEGYEGRPGNGSAARPPIMTMRDATSGRGAKSLSPAAGDNSKGSIGVKWAWAGAAAAAGAALVTKGEADGSMGAKCAVSVGPATGAAPGCLSAPFGGSCSDGVGEARPASIGEARPPILKQKNV